MELDASNREAAARVEEDSDSASAPKDVVPAEGAFPDLVAGSWPDAVPSQKAELHRTWCLHIRCLERAGLGNELRAEVNAYVRSLAQGGGDDEPRSDEWKVLASIPELGELASAELEVLPGQRGVALRGRKDMSAVKRVVTEVRKALAVAARPRFRPSHRRGLARFFTAMAFGLVALLPANLLLESGQGGGATPVPTLEAQAPLATAGAGLADDSSERAPVTSPVPSKKHKFVGLGKRARAARAAR